MNASYPPIPLVVWREWYETGKRNSSAARACDQQIRGSAPGHAERLLWKWASRITLASLRRRTKCSVLTVTHLSPQSAPSLYPETQGAADFGKGVVFYMKGKKVVGVLCWNVFNKIGIARKVSWFPATSRCH